VVPYSNAVIAAQRGLNVLGDLGEIVKEFPDRTFIAERSFIETKRDNARRFFQAVSEAIYRLKTQPQLKERIVGIIAKRLRLDSKSSEEAYDGYHNVFSYPPRVGRRGLQDVLDIIQRELGRPKADADFGRLVDESVLDGLEQDGFFKKLETEYSRK